MATILEEKRSLLETALRLGSIKQPTYRDCLAKIAKLSLSDCREIAKPATHALSHATLQAPGGQTGERQQLAMMPGEGELDMHSRLIGAMGRVRTYMGRRTAVNDKSRSMDIMQAFTAACSALDMLCDELGRAPVNLGLTAVVLSDAEKSAMQAANSYVGLNISAGQIALARAHAPVMSAPAAVVVELSSAPAGELTKHELSSLRAAQSVGVKMTAADMIAARGRRVH